MNKTPNKPLKLRPGDRARVKSPEAILETLDGNGCLDTMPFMPEMFDSCGHVFTIHSRADKTCDTATQTGGRKLSDTVHLPGQRCDGSAHGGCQAACLNFWKEAWLERIEGSGRGSESIAYSRAQLDAAKSSIAKDTTANSDVSGAPVYSCQATRLPEYTTPLSPWDLRQYWRDVTTNKVPITRVLRVAFLSLYRMIVATGIGYRFWVDAYNFVQKARNQPPWPRRSGTLNSTPTEILDLNIGEYVRVKSHDQILETLDKDNRNRGLSFDAEMVRFCGKTLPVHGRVEKIVNEGTGEMMNFSNPCIILKDSWCSSDLSACRHFCPRSIYHYWREIWLERVPASELPKTP